MADDDKHSREWTAKYLEEYEVELFSDGLSLKERYDKKRPDLIITDNRMPGLTGVDFIKYVREECKDKVPIALITADLSLAELAKKYNTTFDIFSEAKTQEKITLEIKE